MKDTMIGHFWQRIPGISDGEYWDWGYAIEHNNPRTDCSKDTYPQYNNNPLCISWAAAIYRNQPGVCGDWTGAIHRNNP